MKRHSRVESRAIATELWTLGLSEDKIADLTGWSLRYVKILLSYFRRTRDWQQLYYVPSKVVIPSVEWRDTFKGFFYGEGTVQFYLRSSRRRLPTPGLSLTLRADEKAILDQAKQYLGGNLVYVAEPSSSGPYRANPQWRWSVVGWHKTRSVLEATELYSSVLPAKKAEEARLLYEAILLRFGLPYKLTDRMRQLLCDYSERIKEVKRFDS